MQKRLFSILNIILGLYAIIAMLMMVRNVRQNFGNLDLHTYWFAGQFMRQRDDPYIANLENRQPNVPIFYIDGPIDREQPVAKTRSGPAAYTAPALFFFSAFSFLSWGIAKTVWTTINFCFALIYLALAINQLSGKNPLPRHLLIFIFVGYMGSIGVRNTLTHGQFSLCVMICILLALRWRERWLIAGILLGFALSKYSVAFPAFLYFIWLKEWRILAVSGVFQAVGVLLFSWLTGSTPLGVMQSYINMLVIHSEQFGLHTAQFFPAESVMRPVITALLACIMIALVIWLMMTSQWFQKSDVADEPMLFLLLMSWGLVGVYHRAYDSVMLLPLLVTIAFLVSDPQVKPLVKRVLWGGLLGIILVLAIPISNAVRLVLPEFLVQSWFQNAVFLMRCALLSAYGIAIWLMVMRIQRIRNKPMV